MIWGSRSSISRSGRMTSVWRMRATRKWAASASKITAWGSTSSRTRTATGLRSYRTAQSPSPGSDSGERGNDPVLIPVYREYHPVLPSGRESPVFGGDFGAQEILSGAAIGRAKARHSARMPERGKVSIRRCLCESGSRRPVPIPGRKSASGRRDPGLFGGA